MINTTTCITIFLSTKHLRVMEDSCRHFPKNIYFEDLLSPHYLVIHTLYTFILLKFRKIRRSLEICFRKHKELFSS